MKSVYSSVTARVLAVAAALLVTLAISGCGDPLISDMEANHRNLGMQCQQDLQQRDAYGLPSTNQALKFLPSP